jgi:hypothetical protein
MIFLNKHTITIARLCEIIDDGKKHKVLKIHLPPFMYKRAYKRFNKEFTEMFGGTDGNLLFSQSLLELDIYHEAYNIIPRLVIFLQEGANDEEHDKYILEEYGLDGFSLDQKLEFFTNEHKKLKDKYDELVYKRENQKFEESHHTFADIIIGTSDNMGGMYVDSKMSMHLFYALYKRAVNKAKANEVNKT